MGCFWPVVIAQGLAHDCILSSDFFQHYGCQIHYDTGAYVVGDAEIPIRHCKGIQGFHVAMLPPIA